MSERVYLVVPFRDKDIVKALGARWDFEKKQWYVSSATQVGDFKKWLPVSFNLEPDSGHASEHSNRVKLSDLLAMASDAIAAIFPFPVFISAEITEIKRNPKSGHTYFSLIERAGSGEELAKCQATLWSDRYSVLLRAEAGLGVKIEPGQISNFLVSPSFSPRYGFSLNILDIEIVLTEGQMQQILKRIRSDLINLGVFEHNKNFSLPSDLFNVAIVAPSGAAGLDDFLVEANRLERLGICSFSLFSARFEGDASTSEIVDAFRRVANANIESCFDLVVIARGGGSVSSLQCLNKKDIAYSICTCPIPVLCAVGHQKDKTILDEVSWLSLGTPSKAISWIESLITNSASMLEQSFASLKSRVLLASAVEVERLERAKDAMFGAASSRISQDKEYVDISFHHIQEGSQMLIVEAVKSLEHYASIVLSSSPKKILGKGFSIVRDNNKALVRQSSSLKSSEPLSISVEFEDGIVSGTFAANTEN